MSANTVPSWLSDALTCLASGNVDAWLDAFTEDAVHEFPFAAPGAQQSLKGKEAIRAYMSRLPSSVRFGSLDDVTVREVADGVVVEAQGHHWEAATGAPFDLRYVWIITRRDGRIARIRDYMGPRRPRNEVN